MSRIHFNEVVTRDGFQNEPAFVPTEAKVALIDELSATPGRHRRNAPTLGQDSDAVLAELGLRPEQIAALRAQGIVD